jgi:hypothetical protein
MGPCRVFTYYKNRHCSINPSEDIENLGRNTLVFASDWDKLPHLRKVAKSQSTATKRAKLQVALHAVIIQAGDRTPPGAVAPFVAQKPCIPFGHWSAMT